MQRNRLKNIINKSKELNKPIKEPYDLFVSSLPSELDYYKDGGKYRLKAAWKAYGEPKNYQEALWQGLVETIGGKASMPSIGYNEENDSYEYLNLGKDNDIVNKDIRAWDNDVIPFIKELKLGGYIRIYNEEKNCWTYSKNKPQENLEINSFLKGGKTELLDIRKRLNQEWPVLANLQFHIVPDSSFTIDKTNSGDIEYFAPDEEDYMTYPNGYKYKNPYKGEASIVYNPNTNDYEDIKMDLLHALRVLDSKYKSLVNEIDKMVLEGDDDLRSNAKLAYDEDYKKYGKEYMPFEHYVENEVDGLLRNLFYNASPEILKKKRYYPNKENLKKWNKHLLPYIQKIEEYLKGNPLAFKQGGQMNVIPEGALHAHKNHMKLAENGDVTAKGIPVVSKDENGDVIQQAEVEREELTVTKDVTDKLESWYDKFFNDDTPQKEKDEIAIKCGKFITKEILFNTDDRVGLISKLLDGIRS